VFLEELYQQAVVPCLLASKWMYAMEPLLKCIVVPIGLSMELYFDSKDGVR
jgi:hypothetical protein